MIPTWWNEAACFGKNMDMFFPQDEDDETQTVAAKMICHTCLVKTPCLNDAIFEDRRTLEPTGIRGEMTGKERQAERIRREGGYARNQVVS